MKILVPLIILALVAIAPNDASARDPFRSDGRQSISVGGSYSGVLVAEQRTSGGPLPTARDVQRTEALGLFTLGVPMTGLASGTVVIFSRGRMFQGDISGFADPDGGNLFAIINTDFEFTREVSDGMGGTVSENVDAAAKGVMTARIVEPTFDRSSISFSNTTRITGSASIDFSEGQVQQDGSDVVLRTVKFFVSGVRRSSFFGAGGG